MKPTSIKLPDELWLQLKEYTATHRLNQSTVVREALVEYFSSHREPAQPSPNSVLGLCEDLCGVLEGSKDLSTNPAHLDDLGQ